MTMHELAPAPRPETTPLALADAPPSVEDAVRGYLGSLRPQSAATMERSLVALLYVMRPDERHTRASAVQFPWYGLRHHHTNSLSGALRERYAPATVNKHLSALTGVLRACWSAGLMSTDDFQRALDFGRPSVSAPERTLCLTFDDIETLLMLARKQRDPDRSEALIALLFGTGVRRGEAARLTREGVTIDPNGQLWVSVCGKGLRWRTVPILGSMQPTLERWLAIYDAKYAGRWTRLFGMSFGSVRNYVKPLFEAAGWTTLSVHDLRRAFCTYLLDNGVQLNVAQRLMGHASPAVTVRYDLSSARRMAHETRRL